MVEFDINGEGKPIVWMAFDRTEYKYPYEEICLRKNVAEALVKIWKINSPYSDEKDFGVYPEEVTTAEKIIEHYTKTNPNDKIEDII